MSQAPMAHRICVSISSGPWGHPFLRHIVRFSTPQVPTLRVTKCPWWLLCRAHGSAEGAGLDTCFDGQTGVRNCPICCISLAGALIGPWITKRSSSLGS